MIQLRKSLCWAAAFIGIAIANRAGLIADANAMTMFAVLPALWVATGGFSRCNLRKRAV